MNDVIKKYTWNPALNLFLTMKEKVQENMRNTSDLPEEQKDILHYWSEYLAANGEPVYKEIISNLLIVQYKEFLLLHYNFINQFDGNPDDFWDMYDGLYMECRSVVIDTKNNCLALVPFRKFRNLNEGKGCMLADIQERLKKAKHVEISEKLDGSMMSARWYDGKLLMASSQALNPGTSWRLADAIRMFYEDLHYTEMLMSNPEKTFIFEYISKKDAHVVQYDQEGLFLIGMRCVDDVFTGIGGMEFSYKSVIEIAQKYRIPATKTFDKTLDQVLTELDDKKANEAEGFVVDIDGFKVKVKYNDYVSMHKMLTKLGSVNCIIRAIADDTYDDLLSKIPEAYRKRIEVIGKDVLQIKEVYEDAVDIIISSYNKWISLAPINDSDKTFADFVNKICPKDFRGYAFCKRKNKPYNVLKDGYRYKKWKDLYPAINLNDVLEEP